ncbi:unnamed protein product, partial [Durusdinium trenchii]
SWSCFDLFGGALCLRKAWSMIESAAMEMWGVKAGLKFSFNVEKNKACTALTTKEYPQSCHFSDILEL